MQIVCVCVGGGGGPTDPWSEQICDTPFENHCSKKKHLYKRSKKVEEHSLYLEFLWVLGYLKVRGHQTLQEIQLHQQDQVYPLALWVLWDLDNFQGNWNCS